MQSETAIVPIICGRDEKTLKMTKLAQERGLFVLPVLSPAVPPNSSRIRAAVTAAHSEADIDAALTILDEVGKAVKVHKLSPKT